jgi:coenzyme F420-reducing hydrogenase gamma subunit
VVCLGPVTRAGCAALCIQGGDRCRGCRGLIDNPRSGPYHRILEEYGLDAEAILREFRTFNVRGGG